MIATAEFCAAPLLWHLRMAPCALDLGVAAVLLLFVATGAALWVARLLRAQRLQPGSAAAEHQQHQHMPAGSGRTRAAGRPAHRGRAASDETTPLLAAAARQPRAAAPTAAHAAHGRAHRAGSSTTSGTLPLPSDAAADPALAEAASQAAASHLQKYSSVARTLSVSILLTCAMDMLADLYFATYPDMGSVMVPHRAARVVADVLAAFAWLIAAAVAFFAATWDVAEYARRANADLQLVGIPAVLQRFWVLALMLEFLRAYNWAVFIAAPDPDTPLHSKLDIALLCIFLVRLSLVALLVTMTSVYQQSARQLARDVAALQDGHLPSPPRNSWVEAISKVRKLFPFLWPRGLYLRTLVVCCFLLLALGRVVNILVPETYKHLVNALSPEPPSSTPPHAPDGGSGVHRPYFAWGLVLLYTFFRFLQGGVGLVSSLQYFLWIPVGQYTSREISVRMLAHLHSLSLQFHINRKTGEVLRVIDRGTASISSLLSYIVFNILPVFIDIAIAVAYFAVTFDWTIALIVLVTMILYIAFTVWITEWRTKFRRDMNDLDSAARGRAVDSLLNFETVKYFGNEAWEVAEYERAIRRYQVADWKSSSSLNLLNTAQNIVITLGLLAGLLLCASRVVDGLLSVGDFVAYIAYLLQLYQPLNWFGTYYRVIQQNFIDMEKMLDLFEEGQAVRDAPDAGTLDVSRGGTIHFDRVCFSYDGQTPVLDQVSFEVAAGKTVALVGPSGGGKSTILRLLFRFYDPTSGGISIDGQDLRSVTQASLRKHIGVVPQDTVLFNDTVMFNIRYGNISAADDEVVEAAKAAQIHDRILSFPEGYNTRVGERGLRLSGGEKQRVAIARTLLKDPAVIVLDEATSALDNQTERLIQDSLRTLCADRTTLVVAHRLSTVVDADEILVVRDGRIVERGTHEELLRTGESALRAQLASAAAAAAVASGGVGAIPPPPAFDIGAGTYYQMWHREVEERQANEAAASPDAHAHAQAHK
ncbi:ATP-binding cassette-type vacuolar membrane transporter Hmt1 [Polyrhizophydium stewartii]|uniref:ATP-binding cassette-type vacuolar membrane transporter Hmt1 n=1 Tax=Polyrhizophydium stewartii TaxID=2732419 RepID=A0ABR4MV29_9FUNG